MKNNKGFTLIELLAVITIMGILMMVAIPTVSRTIENARKDTFLDLAKQYSNAVKNLWYADGFECGGYPSSAVQTGTYMVQIDTASTSTPQLLESGGKSPWGNRDIKGLVVVAVFINDNTRDIRFFPSFVDGIHGINVDPSRNTMGTVRKAESLKRGHIIMSGATYSIFMQSDNTTFRGLNFTADLNNDGDRVDIIDGVNESSGATVVCVER